jgi:hypothetical protein
VELCVTITIAIAHTGATNAHTGGYAHTNTHAITTDTPTLEPSPQSQYGLKLDFALRSHMSNVIQK